jgi:RimJ/RimL family protein N-acetyltransferase
MHILNTERLTVSWLTPDDAPFVLELVNDPDWLRFIGDKNIHSLEGARAYIENGPMAMYAQRGFGLYRVALLEDNTPIGMCGLIKRDTLEDVDIGYAFLAAFRGHGYAREAAGAVLEYGRIHFDLRRIVATTNPDNAASRKVLEQIGLGFEKLIPSVSGAGESALYAVDFS